METTYAVTVFVLLVVCTIRTDERPREKVQPKLLKDAVYFEQILEAEPSIAALIRPLTSHHSKY